MGQEFDVNALASEAVDASENWQNAEDIPINKIADPGGVDVQKGSLDVIQENGGAPSKAAGGGTDVDTVIQRMGEQIDQYGKKMEEYGQRVAFLDRENQKLKQHVKQFGNLPELVQSGKKMEALQALGITPQELFDLAVAAAPEGYQSEDQQNPDRQQVPSGQLGEMMKKMEGLESQLKDVLKFRDATQQQNESSFLLSLAQQNELKGFTAAPQDAVSYAQNLIRAWRKENPHDNDIPYQAIVQVVDEKMKEIGKQWVDRAKQWEQQQQQQPLTNQANAAVVSGNGSNDGSQTQQQGQQQQQQSLSEDSNVIKEQEFNVDELASLAAQIIDKRRTTNE